MFHARMRTRRIIANDGATVGRCPPECARSSVAIAWGVAGAGDHHLQSFDDVQCNLILSAARFEAMFSRWMTLTIRASEAEFPHLDWDSPVPIVAYSTRKNQHRSGPITSGAEVPEESVVAHSIAIRNDAVGGEQLSLPTGAVVPIGTPGGDREVSPSVSVA